MAPYTLLIDGPSGAGKTTLALQIGEALGLAEKTVKNYVTSVLAKPGMERRTQAAVYMASKERRGEPQH